jgi:hypothetical protein
MSTTRTARRLPGFRFETVSPPLAEWLPRMDVTCFAGFAASGPLDTPVAVESPAQFDALFGADAPLAWDAAVGEQVYAYLGPAVRAFFANGGLRCWVVRVARRQTVMSQRNRARYNYFPLPGLAMASLDADGNVAEINPAFARARSEGSWSDALETGTALLSDSVEVLSLALDNLQVDLAVDKPDDIGAGDLLRLTFDEGYVLLLYVGSVEVVSTSTASARGRVRITGAQGVWLGLRAPAGQPVMPTQINARLFNIESPMQTDYDEEQTVFDRFLITYSATMQPVVNDDAALAGQSVKLDLDIAPLDAPSPGSLVVVDLPSGGQLLLTVGQSSVTKQGAAATGTGVRITGQGVWWTGRAPDALPSNIKGAEKLSFELWARKPDEYSLSVGDLAFHPAHARFWAQLPTDRQLYETDDSGQVKQTNATLWQPVGGELRFPLAGSPGGDEAVYLPLSVPVVPDQFLDAVRLPGTSLERDGLAEFDAGLFLDADLIGALAEDLLSRADFLRYLSPAPRRLSGIHAALEIEEVTLLSVPDALHRGWTKTDPKNAPLPAPSEPLARPQWWRFDCAKRENPPPVSQPEFENFLDCGVRVVAPPQLSVSTELTQTGTFTLMWTSDERDARFILEEAGALDTEQRITGAEELYEGTLTRFTLYGRPNGDYYYRVRVVASDGNESDWSNGVAVRVTSAGAWQARSTDDYDNSVLLAVQRGLLRLAAARGDLLAVLALPEHYREDKTLEHVALLKKIAGASGKGTPDAVTLEGVPPFNGGESYVFSYGALYHPWLVGDGAQAQSSPRRVPPEGAACGVLAQRALTRGAWVAPANETLNGVVALTPRVRRERWLDLQDAQLNLVRQEARGFLVMNADTLSDDDSLRLINVRRLLILLRRLALRHGATYVFEPNSDAFRRSVERGFSSLLDLMFARGAFAGATAATSYQVKADNTLNTPQSVEQGRFIVELRVAPSEPMTFMTIRLVQTGASGVVTEVN